MNCAKMMAAGLVLAMAGSVMAGPDADKIAATGVKVFQKAKCQGFDWIMFEYEGCEAWVFGSTAFQDRAGVKALLEAGFRWVSFNPAYAPHIKVTEGNQNDEMIAKRLKYQKFLVKTLGLEEKCGLIGMSWGGFYSVRYASEHPECVKAMYLDAPLLDFSTLGGFKAKSWKNYVKYWPTITADYVGADDPMQPVAPARAVKIAKAKIPVLCIYGGKDGVVPPEKNCLRFAEAYEKAGGHLKLWRDNLRGHHPHGLEPNEQQVFVNFFNAE